MVGVVQACQHFVTTIDVLWTGPVLLFVKKKDIEKIKKTLQIQQTSGKHQQPLVDISAPKNPHIPLAHCYCPNKGVNKGIGTTLNGNLDPHA